MDPFSYCGTTDSPTSSEIYDLASDLDDLTFSQSPPITGIHLHRCALDPDPDPSSLPNTSISSSIRKADDAGPSRSRSSLPSSPSGTSNKAPIQPEWVLEAPSISDNFYWNVLSWSSTDLFSVALHSEVYLWKVDSEEITHLPNPTSRSEIASVEFSQDGGVLALGLTSGLIELWDVESRSILRTIPGHLSEIYGLSWNGHILSSGSFDSTLWHLDIRLGRPKVRELLGHRGSVCGVKWRDDGVLLASGDTEGRVQIWDNRFYAALSGPGGQSLWMHREHNAAVKALAWCPWKSSLLASGGGSSDGKLHFRDTGTGIIENSVKLGITEQVTSIQWSPFGKDFLVTLGYTSNGMLLHRYPTMEQIIDARGSHNSRVLWSAIGPRGDLVCTGSGDGNVKFWRIWDVQGPCIGSSRGTGG